jgi:uncharacterized repeat protein (TIGR02543 family)
MKKVSTLLVSCLLSLYISTAWAEGVDDLPKSNSYGGTQVAASAFNLIAGVDFTLEVTGTTGQEISIAGGLIKYTPEAGGTVRFAQASGVVYVWEGSAYKGIVAVNASAVSFPDLFAETNDVTAQTGIYNSVNLLQNPGFETLPNNVWLAYNADDASVDITNVGTGGTSIRAKTTMEGDYVLLLHGGAKYFTQSLSAGVITPNTYYKAAYKYHVNATGSQGGAVVRAQLGTTEKASDIVTTSEHTTPTDNTNVLDVIEVIATGSSVDTENPVWFTIERTSGTGTGGEQKLEYYDNLTLVAGTLSTGITNGSENVNYLSGTAYAPEGALSVDASLSDLQIDGITISGFSATTYDYFYYLAPGTTTLPAVTATATHTAAGAVVVDATTIPGQATVTVTAEDGTTQLVYTVIFDINYLYGWNDNNKNGDTTTPNDLGWDVPEGTTVSWGHENSNNSFRTNTGPPINNGSNAMLYITSPNTAFSYPAPVPAKKIYQLTGNIWHRNGGDLSDCTYSFDLADSREGDNIYSQANTNVLGNNVFVPFTERLSVPATIAEDVYFRLSAQQNAGNFENSGFVDLLLVEVGDALVVTFDLGEATATVDPQYLLAGSDETAVQPADPEWEGYTFEGWYTDNTYATAYDFATPVTSDVSIYAKWDTETGLNSILAADAVVSAEYYTLQGQKIAQPATKSGVYIVKKIHASNKVSVEKVIYLNK